MSRPAYRAYSVNVADVERLSPSFVRVTFAADDLADLGWDGPDQRIKVVLPLPGSGYEGFPGGDDWYREWRLLPLHQRNPIRTYTIRRADPAARELVVDFVTHGDTGPASRWVNRAAVGDQVAVVAPDATAAVDAGGYEWRPGRATTLLIAGDETAVPAVSAILETLADDARGAVFLEVPEPADALPLQAPAGIELTWLPRGAVADHGEHLVDAVRTWAGAWVAGERSGTEPDTDLPEVDPDLLWEVPAEPEDDGLYAWLAGEAGAITGLRRHLVRDLGIDRSRVAFMGYWKRGRAEN